MCGDALSTSGGREPRIEDVRDPHEQRKRYRVARGVEALGEGRIEPFRSRSWFEDERRACRRRVEEKVVYEFEADEVEDE